MSIDVQGNLYATAGQGKTAGVNLFNPQGEKIGFIPTPEDPSIGLVNALTGSAQRHGYTLADITLLIHGTTGHDANQAA